MDFYKADAANLNCNETQNNVKMALLSEDTGSKILSKKTYLWFISVLNLEFLKVGKFNLSRNRGFASINFLSSASITPLADLVSPYFDSCSLSLHICEEKN